MSFKSISIFSSGTHFDKWSITICAVLVENIMGNTHVKFGPMILKMLFKDISILISGGHFVQWNGNTCAISI